MKNKLIYNDHTSFEDAIRSLDENGNGFLAVVDESNKLIGILTDGDIRRAILHKKKDLKDIINKHPITFNCMLPRKQAIQYLKSIHRRHLPLVDNDNKLIDVIILDDIEFNAKPNKIIVMAGGHGTRLGELTKNIPKPMLTVGNKPILEYILTHCYEQGFTNIYVSVNYKSEVIKEYFRDGSSFGLSIKYIEEKEKLGTAGALSLIEETFQEPFIVINGDILTTLNLDTLLNHHLSTKSDATMCTREIEYQLAYGVVNIDGTRITSLREKPTQKLSINAGIYVLSPSVINFIPKKQYYDMTSLFEQLLQNGLSVNSYPLKDYWIDIGQIQDYESANKDIKIDL